MLPDTELECFFLDVGQGTSQIISLGDKKAIVVDVGPRPPKEDRRNILIQLLSDLRIDYIEALVLSHNDLDHIGNAANLLTQYRGSIGKIFLLQDRDAQVEKNFSDLLVLLEDFVSEGDIEINDIRRLEKTAGQQQIIYQNTGKSGAKISLEILYPLSIMNSLSAQRQGTPNTTCGVLMLQVGSSKVIFSGDAPINAWQRIYTENACASLEANIASLPHHGGNIGANDDELLNLHNTIIGAGTLIVSVGNRYGHPKINSIQAVTKTEKEILCTQMTPRCCPEYDRLILSPRRFIPPIISQSQRKGLACAGTVAVNVSPTAVEIQHIEKYQRWKSQHSGRMCAPASSSQD